MQEELTINVKLSRLAVTLRRLRTERGFSIDDVSKITRIRGAKLMKWELDKALPSRQDIERLAQFYGVQPEQIWGTSDQEDGLQYKIHKV